MNLFVIYIGGSHPRSLIELHDIRFVVAQSLEQTYDFLKHCWWGTPNSLHIDAWGILKQADGYDIHFSQDKFENRNKLYFVNLGGYDPTQFTELHKNIFVVAENKEEAKKKALREVSEWQSAHRDNLYDIDQVLELNTLLSNQGHHLHLHKQVDIKAFEFTCTYKPIGKS